MFRTLIQLGPETAAYPQLPAAKMALQITDFGGRLTVTTHPGLQNSWKNLYNPGLARKKLKVVTTSVATTYFLYFFFPTHALNPSFQQDSIINCFLKHSETTPGHLSSKVHGGES